MMASTEQIRVWYHHNVVLNHAQRGKAGYTPRCNHDHPTVGFPRGGGGVFNEPVHPLTVEAWQSYIATMNHHGETMPSSGGVNQCRNIARTAWPSLHAYLCAVDLPPNTRKTAAFIADVETIRTNSGAQVFRNLAGDRMHDQINCSPADLTTGIDWSTVPGHQQLPEEDDMWQYLNIDESLVRHAHTQGWLQPKTEATLDYFLLHLADLQEAVAPAHFAKDWLNFRRAVSNGIARGGAQGPEGDPGTDGKDGAAGKDGTDGISETAVVAIVERARLHVG